MVSATRLVFAVALVAVGAGLVYWGRRRYRVYRLVTETATSSVGEISDGDTVGIAGAVVADETIASPLVEDGLVLDGESVLDAWLVRDRRTRRGIERWAPTARGIESVPFRVDDGTGELFVDVGNHADGWIPFPPLSHTFDSPRGVTSGGVLCRFSKFVPVMTVDSGEEPPGRLAEFATWAAALDPDQRAVNTGTRYRDRRVWVGSVEPGAEVFVLGEARRVADGDPDDPEWVVKPPRGRGDIPTVVSAGGKQSLIDRARRGTHALWFGGAMAFAGGLLAIHPFTPYF